MKLVGTICKLDRFLENWHIVQRKLQIGWPICQSLIGWPICQSLIGRLVIVRLPWPVCKLARLGDWTEHIQLEIESWILVIARGYGLLVIDLIKLRSAINYRILNPHNTQMTAHKLNTIQVSSVFCILMHTARSMQLSFTHSPSECHLLCITESTCNLCKFCYLTLLNKLPPNCLLQPSGHALALLFPCTLPEENATNTCLWEKK